MLGIGCFLIKNMWHIAQLMIGTSNLGRVKEIDTLLLCKELQIYLCQQIGSPKKKYYKDQKKKEDLP
jgi:hypothetical protein